MGGPVLFHKNYTDFCNKLLGHCTPLYLVMEG